VLDPFLERARKVLDQYVDPALMARLEQLPHQNLNAYGVDPFGFSPEYFKYAAALVQYVYKYYFRVEAFGLENLPDKRVLLIGNHSGQLPFDAMMVISSVFLKAPQPRVVRAMIERWVPTLPFVSYLFLRFGQIVGDPDSCRRLLEAEEAVLVFPEGARGINKMWTERYRLKPFSRGFMRLALASNAPVVPLAVIGAEEQALALMNIKPLAQLLSMPAFPITPTLLPFPLPTKYRIYFGEPLHFRGDPDEDDASIDSKVQQVVTKVQRLIQEGLRERGGRVFY
jgi:1-acyl-sn-glycerol-3-phosphate acyltransferase